MIVGSVRCVEETVVWVFISLLDFSVWGVWLGIATAVTSGWVLSLIVAQRVAQTTMGSLLKPAR